MENKKSIDLNISISLVFEYDEKQLSEEEAKDMLSQIDYDFEFGDKNKDIIRVTGMRINGEIENAI